MTDIFLTKDIEADILALEKMLKTVPQVILNICLRIGMNELKEAFQLLPEKYKSELLQALKEIDVIR